METLAIGSWVLWKASGNSATVCDISPGNALFRKCTSILGQITGASPLACNVSTENVLVKTDDQENIFETKSDQFNSHNCLGAVEICQRIMKILNSSISLQCVSPCKRLNHADGIVG